MPRIVRAAAGGATILAVLSGAACSSHDRPAPRASVVRDSAGVTIVQNDPASADTGAWSIASKPRTRIQAFVVPEETGSTFSVQVAGATQIAKNQVVIADPDADQVRWFDRAGQFMSAASHRGNGLGTLTRMDELFRAPSDSIVVADRSRKSYVVLDPHGRFVRQMTLVGFAGDTNVHRGAEVWVDGMFADGTPLLSTNADVPDATRHDTAAAARNAPRIRLLRGDWHGIIHADYGIFTRGLYAASGSSLYYGDTASSEIRVYDATGKLRRIIRTGPDSAKQPGQPARFDALRVDPTGNIWARLSASGGSAPMNRWYVYDSTGVVRHVLADHGPAIPQEVGTDYVLGFDRDPGGIMYVESFPIEKHESAQSPTPAGTP